MSLSLRRLPLLSLAAASLLLAALTGCARRGCTDERSVNFDAEAQVDDGSCVQPFALSQAQLNAISTRVAANVTGNTLGGTFTVPHILTDGSLTSTLETYRDIYSTRTTLTPPGPEGYPVGTVYVKRMHDRNTVTGAYGARRNTYIMVKQYAGYYPEGGDWQYYAIPQNLPDTSNVNATFPNGWLVRAAFAGKVDLCSSCHAKAPNGKFVFTP